MKFYRMMNGDIVTGVQLVMGAPALKATKVFDDEKQQYCFTTCLYREGVKERLTTVQKTVLVNQLNLAIKLNRPHEDSQTVDRPPFWNKKEINFLRGWLDKAKAGIHDYTA